MSVFDSSEAWAEWRERVGMRVFHELNCGHDFDSAICEKCWNSAQRICAFIERELRERNEAREALAAVAALAEAPDVPGVRSGRVSKSDLRVVLADHADTLANIRADVWNEAAESTADWMANNPSPAGIPSDPPRNPYLTTPTP